MTQPNLQSLRVTLLQIQMTNAVDVGVGAREIGDGEDTAVGGAVMAVMADGRPK